MSVTGRMVVHATDADVADAAATSAADATAAAIDRPATAAAATDAAADAAAQRSKHNPHVIKMTQHKINTKPQKHTAGLV